MKGKNNKNPITAVVFLGLIIKVYYLLVSISISTVCMQCPGRWTEYPGTCLLPANLSLWLNSYLSFWGSPEHVISSTQLEATFLTWIFSIPDFIFLAFLLHLQHQHRPFAFRIISFLPLCYVNADLAFLQFRIILPTRPKGHSLCQRAYHLPLIEICFVKPCLPQLPAPVPSRNTQVLSSK